MLPLRPDRLCGKIRGKYKPVLDLRVVFPEISLPTWEAKREGQLNIRLASAEQIQSRILGVSLSLNDAKAT